MQVNIINKGQEICQTIPNNFGNSAVFLLCQLSSEESRNKAGSDQGDLSFLYATGLGQCVTCSMAEPSDLLRFETDLEFLQSLANPQYLNCMPCPLLSEL